MPDLHWRSQRLTSLHHEFLSSPCCWNPCHLHDSEPCPHFHFRCSHCLWFCYWAEMEPRWLCPGHDVAERRVCSLECLWFTSVALCGDREHGQCVRRTCQQPQTAYQDYGETWENSRSVLNDVDASGECSGTLNPDSYITYTMTIERELFLLQEWGCEGYHLWVVSDQSPVDADYSKASGEDADRPAHLLQLQFVKSALAVNPCMVGQGQVDKNPWNSFAAASLPPCCTELYTWTDLVDEPWTPVPARGRQAVFEPWWLCAPGGSAKCGTGSCTVASLLIARQ